MDELLGFVVLTGPLLPILIWLTVSFLLVTHIVKPAGNIYRRGTIKLLIFFIVFLLPFLDEIAGQVYLKYLCETQGGFKVYQTVELPDEYWDENGKPMFLRNGRSLDAAVLTGYGVTYNTEQHPLNIKFSVLRGRYVNKKNNKILGEVTTFEYGGGWLLNTFSAGGVGKSCDIAEIDSEKERVLSIFIPINE